MRTLLFLEAPGPARLSSVWLARGYKPMKSTSRILVPKRSGIARPNKKSKKTKMKPNANTNRLLPDSLIRISRIFSRRCKNRDGGVFIRSVFKNSMAKRIIMKAG